jgi:hypothetical protein
MILILLLAFLTSPSIREIDLQERFFYFMVRGVQVEIKAKNETDALNKVRHMLHKYRRVTDISN